MEVESDCLPGDFVSVIVTVASGSQFARARGVHMAMLAPPSPEASSPASTAMADELASPHPLGGIGACFALLPRPVSSSRPAPTELIDSPAASALSRSEASDCNVSPVAGTCSLLAAGGDVSSLAMPAAAAPGEEGAPADRGDAAAHSENAARSPLAANGDVSSLAAPAAAPGEEGSCGEDRALADSADAGKVGEEDAAVPQTTSLETSTVVTKGGSADAKDATDAEGESSDAKAAVAARVLGVGKTGKAKGHGVGRKSTHGAPNGVSNLRRPVRRKPAAADTSAKSAVAVRDRGGGKTRKAKAPGVDRKKMQEAADDDKNLHKPVRGRPAPVASRGQRRVDALDAKYPWGREGGPPPASETEQRSLADQIVRLRIEAANFRKPERLDVKRLARANALLDVMRDKARAGFGGGQALARRGFNLNKSRGLALAKRARKLAIALEAHFDPEGAPSVLIEESLAMTHSASA